MPNILDIVKNGQPLHLTKGKCAGISLQVSEKYDQKAVACYQPGDPFARVLGWKNKEHYFFVCDDYVYYDAVRIEPHISLIYLDNERSLAYMVRDLPVGQTLMWYMSTMQVILRDRKFVYLKEQEFGYLSPQKNEFIHYHTSFLSLPGNNVRLNRGLLSELWNLASTTTMFYTKIRCIKTRICGIDTDGSGKYYFTGTEHEYQGDIRTNLNRTWVGGFYPGAILFPMKGENKVVLRKGGLEIIQSPDANLFWVQHPSACLVKIKEDCFPVQGYECSAVSAALTDYKEVIANSYHKLLRCIEVSSNRRERYIKQVYTGGPLTLTPRHSRLAGNCAAGTYRFMRTWRKGLPEVDPEEVTWENFPVPLNQEYRLYPAEIRRMANSDMNFKHLVEQDTAFLSRQIPKAILRRARRKKSNV